VFCWVGEFLGDEVRRLPLGKDYFVLRKMVTRDSDLEESRRRLLGRVLGLLVGNVPVQLFLLRHA
jgi:hypothetical protein